MEQTTKIGNVYLGASSAGGDDLSNYYTKDQTDALITNLKNDLVNGADVDLDSFKEVVDYVNNYISSDEEASENILTQIAGKANSSDVYTKTETDAQIDADVAVISNNLANNYYNKAQVYTKAEIEDKLSDIDISGSLENYYTKNDVYNKTEIDTKVLNINTSIEEKQNKLTPGEGITITEDGIISSTGGGGSSSEGTAEMIFSDVADETGTPLRTIKVGEDVWSIPEGGSGGSADLSDYYTKDEISALDYQNSTQVQAAISTNISALIGSAPEELNTLEELATALSNNPDVLETMNAAITNKQDKLTAGENITIENGVISATGGSSSGSSSVSRKAYEVLLNMGTDISTSSGSTGQFNQSQAFSYTEDLGNKKWMLCFYISDNQGNSIDCRTNWNTPAATEIVSSSGVVGLSLNSLNSWYVAPLSITLGRYIFHFYITYSSSIFSFQLMGFNSIKYSESDEEQQSLPSTISIYPKYLIIEE